MHVVLVPTPGEHGVEQLPGLLPGDDAVAAELLGVAVHEQALAHRRGGLLGREPARAPGEPERGETGGDGARGGRGVHRLAASHRRGLVRRRDEAANAQQGHGFWPAWNSTDGAGLNGGLL